MLKIHDLRQEAYASWELLCSVKGVYKGAPDSDELPEIEASRLPWTNAIFKAEIRKTYGDTRCRKTWERAAIELTALQMVHSYLDPVEILSYMASPDFMRCPIRQNYGEQVIDFMLQVPEIIEIVKAGLEQIYTEPTPPEQSAIAQRLVNLLVPPGQVSEISLSPSDQAPPNNSSAVPSWTCADTL